MNAHEPPRPRTARRHRPDLWLVAAAFVGAVTLAAGAPGVATAQDARDAGVVDRIVAVVNDEIITSHDLEKVCELRREFRELKRQNPTDPQLDLMRKHNLGLLVDERLLLQVVKVEKIEWTEADDKDLEKALLKEAEPHGSIEALDDALRRLDIKPELLRERLRRDITLSRLFLKKIRADIFIRPEAMRRYYDANPGEFQTEAVVKLRQVFIAFGNDPAGARKRIDEVRASLVAGARIEDVAGKVGDDPKRDAGGEWVFEKTTRVEMIEPVGDVANKLPVGQLSEVLESKRGYHVIVVTERRARAMKPFSEVHEQIQTVLQRQEWDERLDRWMAELRSHAFIRVFSTQP